MKAGILTCTILATLLCLSPCSAELKRATVEYEQNGAVLEGYLVYDDAFKGPRPGVVVFHEWMGIGPYEKGRSEQLAELGYLVLAADIYGKGQRPKTREEAAKMAAIYRNDRSLLRARARAAIELIRQHELADPNRIAAIGYCFGGTTVLELARSGADIAGVVSFHGGLDTPPRPRLGASRARCWSCMAEMIPMFRSSKSSPSSRRCGRPVRIGSSSFMVGRCTASPIRPPATTLL